MLAWLCSRERHLPNNFPKALRILTPHSPFEQRHWQQKLGRSNPPSLSGNSLSNLYCQRHDDEVAVAAVNIIKETVSAMSIFLRLPVDTPF